jgi:hypothetical protein
MSVRHGGESQMMGDRKMITAVSHWAQHACSMGVTLFLPDQRRLHRHRSSIVVE